MENGKNVGRDVADMMERVRARNRATGRTPGVYVITFGCQQNEADGEKLRGMAEQMGYSPVERPEEADLILLNTCAVREHAELRALSIIGTCKHLREKNPGLIVGVCGCMTARESRVEQLRRGYPYVSFTLEPSALHRLPEVLLSVMEQHKRRFLLGEEAEEIPEGLPVRRTHRHRAYVSIMYGCNNFCTYCIVPYVRGRERSRGSAAIVDEVRALVADGCKDITLLGQNVNSYRSDCDFAELMDRICRLPGDFLLRFMTSHPKDVSDRLIAVMAAHPERVAPHFHLPLQSGSDRILSAMNRKYTAKGYLGTVERLRRAMPDIALTTDVIVGFPGESEADFAATCDVLRRVGYDMVYSFLYSPREGTPAANMENPLTEAERSARFSRLLACANEMAAASNRKYEGCAVRVLVDGVSKNDSRLYSGRTAAGKLVHFAAAPSDVGEFRTVRILRADSYVLHGELVQQKP